MTIASTRITPTPTDPYTDPTTATVKWLDIFTLIQGLQTERDEWAAKVREDPTNVVAKRIMERHQATLVAVRRMWHANPDGDFVITVTPKPVAS